jgi:hypothetical protein
MGDWDDDGQSEEKTNFSRIQEDTNLRNYLQKCHHHMMGTPPPTLPASSAGGTSELTGEQGNSLQSFV